MAEGRHREFQEIAHSGLNIAFDIETRDGTRGFVVEAKAVTRNAVSFTGVYVTIDGHILTGFMPATLSTTNDPPPPTSDSVPVIFASDREGMYGRECPRCHGYFRSESVAVWWKTICPYCGLIAPMHQFMTAAQCHYIEHYVTTFLEAWQSDQEKIRVEIKMDEYADQASKEVEVPKFYYAEERQQSHWSCVKCGTRNDILGHYGYCSCCGYRNNLPLLTDELTALSEKTTATDQDQRALLRNAISAFEACCRSYIDQILDRMPMTPRRRKRLEGLRFHEPRRFLSEIGQCFDIEMADGMKLDDVEFAHIRFHRRHLYEHKAGVVDQEYIDASGDNQKLNKRLDESPGNVRHLIEVLLAMAANLDAGFHAMFGLNERALKVLAKRTKPKAGASSL